MRIYLSRSIYDDKDKIQKIKKSLGNSNDIIDGVEFFENALRETSNRDKAFKRCLKEMEKCDLIVFVPCFTPGVLEEYTYARKQRLNYKILRRIVR